MHADESNLDDLSRPVIGGGFVVRNALGTGFPEKVYQNALVHERRKAVLAVEQHSLTVTYDGIVAGEYAADPIAERPLLVE